MNFSQKHHTHKKESNRFVNNKMAAFLFIAFALCAMKVDAQTTRYVDTTGSDTGNCTDPLSACATITYTMTMAGSGDIIDLASGVYTEQVNIEKDLIFQGAGSTQPGGTIIQAHAQPEQASGPTVTIVGEYTVQMSGLMVRNGADMEGGEGGGIYSDNANLTLTDVAITDNVASYGGGLFLIGTTTLIDVSFNNNSATYGGGLYNFSGVVNATNVSFTNNTGTIQGGGLLNESDMTLTNVSFTNNTSDYFGGAFAASGEVTLTDVIFTNNTSNVVGGAMFLAGSAILTNVDFTDNTAETGDGGAVYILNGSTTTFDDVTFANNTSGNHGGAIYMMESSMGIFSDVTFTNNATEAEGIGGAIYITESTADFSNSYFINNNAPNEGGAVYITDSQASFMNTTFTGNEATQGGGVYAFDSEITLVDVLIEENIAESGGGLVIASSNNNNVLIKNTYFKNNEATVDYGGGLINEGGIATVVNTLFTGNKSLLAGGAIANVGELHLLNNTITQNEGTTVGAGGIYHLMGNLTMTNSIVWGNIGPEGPDIANADGVFTSNHSLYDDTDVFNEGTFTCDDCLTINPDFADATGGDFTLSSSSPALDAGDPDTNLTEFPKDGNNNPIDLNGNARIYNNIIDMGAYEQSTLSSNDFNNTNLQIVMHPNPVSNILHIETDQVIEHIAIYSITGQNLQTWKNQNRIDLSNYTTGTYFVKITTPNSSIVKQVIKQ